LNVCGVVMRWEKDKPDTGGSFGGKARVI